MADNTPTLNKDTRVPAYVLVAAILMAVTATRFMDTNIAKSEETAGLGDSLKSLEDQLDDAIYESREARNEATRGFAAIKKDLESLTKSRWNYSMMREWTNQLQAQNVERGLEVPNPQKVKQANEGL